MHSAALLILASFCLSFTAVSAGFGKSEYDKEPLCHPHGFYCPITSYDSSSNYSLSNYSSSNYTNERTDEVPETTENQTRPETNESQVRDEWESHHDRANQSSNYTCLPRTQRCTTNDTSDQCTSKTYQHCDYNEITRMFTVRRYSSHLQLFGRKRWYKIEHQFLTYRGLMYEYGKDYGARVQDPNDPDYEYNKRKIISSKKIGESVCTYEQVIPYLDYWKQEDYRLFSNNCQDFVKGLTKYLESNCVYLEEARKRSATELAEYFFSLCKENCTTSDSQSSDYAPLDLDVLDTTTSYNGASNNEIALFVFAVVTIVGLVM